METARMGLRCHTTASNDVDISETDCCSGARQLSRGERSKATLAMLLAVGRTHECPFR